MPRQFNRSTPLGEVLHSRGWRVADLEYASGVLARTISDYLAGRREMPGRHVQAFADALDVDPSVFGGGQASTG